MFASATGYSRSPVLRYPPEAWGRRDGPNHAASLCDPVIRPGALFLNGAPGTFAG